MTSVAIHLTDAGVHVDAQGEHWGNATECLPLTTAEDAFATVGRDIVPTSDALYDVVESAIGRAGSLQSVTAIAMTHPTHWGTVRIREFREVALRVTPDVTMVPVASVAVRSVGQNDDVHVAVENHVVLEASDAGVVVTFVDSSHAEYRLSGCDIDHGDGGLVAAVRRVSDGRIVKSVLVCDGEAVADMESFRAELFAEFGRKLPVRTVSAAKIARALDEGWRRSPEPLLEREPSRTHWLSATQQNSDTARAVKPSLLLVGSVTAVLAGCAVAMFLYVGRSPDSVRAAPGIRTTVSTAPSTPPETTPVRTPTSQAAPSTTAASSGAAVTELGRLRIHMPAGWQQAPASKESASVAPGRFELVPTAGEGRRIVVVQKQIRGGAGYDEVASTLAEQMARRNDPDQFSRLERDVVFGGRPGLSYHEYPDDSSEVNWHVLVDQGMQVSVGCQFRREQWAKIAETCDQVVRSLEVAE